ncbi:MAG TPA: DinB family protein [Longimicrobiales bacterium]
MKRIAAVFALLVAFGVSAAQAQEKASAAAASTTGITNLFHMAHANIVKAAEQIPEDKYAFQPTKEVRTLGALFAHIADANFMFCSMVGGTPGTASAEKTAKTKAEIVAALKASYDACGAAYGKITDADLAKPVKIFGRDSNYSGALTFNTSHNWEHYGNIVTYMRLNGMVPPSSQQ